MLYNRCHDIERYGLLQCRVEILFRTRSSKKWKQTTGERCSLGNLLDETFPTPISCVKTMISLLDQKKDLNGMRFS